MSTFWLRCATSRKRLTVSLVAASIILGGCNLTSDRDGADPAAAPELASHDASKGPVEQASYETPVAGSKAPTEFTSLLARTRLVERRGELAKAERMYQELARREPKHPAPYHRMGVIAAKTGRFSDAERMLSRAAEMAPTNVEVLADLGYMFYLQHRLAESERVLRRALSHDSQSEVVCNNLALVVGAAGRYDECLSLFKRNCDDAQAHANLAYVLTQAGNLEGAKKHYLYALSLDSKLKPAAKALLQVDQSQQKRDEMLARAKSSPGKDNKRPADSGLVEVTPRDGAVRPASYQASGNRPGHHGSGASTAKATLLEPTFTKNGAE